jgi:putative nucleotidyltransferase with HDIG domain
MTVAIRPEMASFDPTEALEERAMLRSLIMALRTRDAETYEHSIRVVKCSLRLGRECTLDRTQMRSLEFGSLLHDIGKIGVPDSILRKPARLTEEEWAIMRRHTEHGERILLGISFLEETSLLIAQHHERWDGTGYPMGLIEDEIDLKARMLAVADAFDAMVSERVYRARRTDAEALAELDRCAGTQFDPKVVEAFHRIHNQDGRERGGKRGFLINTSLSDSPDILIGPGR